MFLGNYTVRLREKNRITFPARFRQQTGDKLLITNWFENSLMILPKKEWERLTHEIFEKASYLLPEVRDLDRFIFGGTYEIELDKEGRFVIPSYLKGYAEIKTHVLFIGGMWYIQLWDKERFENYRELISLQVKDNAKSVFKNLKEKYEK